MMGPFYLIYHPERHKSKIGNLTIYHDSLGGNEDPYIWNKNFLHTYCHITQLSNETNQVNFWVSGDTTLNDYTKLYCDCVFNIAEKVYWEKNNSIDREDSLVDNQQSFNHHYKYGNLKIGDSHFFNRRRRYTLKANAVTSFQPQDGKGNLLNILPFLNKNGLTTQFLIKSLKAARGSKPCRLDDKTGLKLYNNLVKKADVKLFGKDLQKKHPHRKINAKITNCC